MCRRLAVLVNRFSEADVKRAWTVRRSATALCGSDSRNPLVSERPANLRNTNRHAGQKSGERCGCNLQKVISIASGKPRRPAEGVINSLLTPDKRPLMLW